VVIRSWYWLKPVDVKKILWLPGWYPNRQERFDGDFIQRHAHAVAGGIPIHVIYVVKHSAAFPGAEKERIQTGKLTEEIIYYRTTKSGIRFLDRILSYRKYLAVYRKAIREYINKEGKPSYVHVHVALKVGVLARWIKTTWGVPYLISEHWTGYLEEADHRLEHLPALQQSQLEQVFREAAGVTVVSDHLGRAIQKHFPFIMYKVIPNVVDDSIFYPASSPLNDAMQLIHVSNMSYQKNTEAILKALSILKQSNFSFQMNVYGSSNPAIETLLDKLDLKEQVCIKGEVPQPELAEGMRHSTALVLYSRFETFGCVIIEANASGIPVILSDLPVFQELVEEGKNGVFVQQDDPEALAEAIRAFAGGKTGFDPIQIAADVRRKYGYEPVAKTFIALYH